MSNWTLSVGLEGNLGNLPSVMAQGTALIQNFGRAVDDKLAGVKGSFNGLRGELSSTLFSPAWVTANEQHLNAVGKAVAGFGAVVLTGIGFAAKAAIDWESAWAGVEKTTDATAAQLPALERGLRDLTSVLPASHAEIAAVAEAAGQLGIKSADVIDFTRVMIDLGESTNVTSDAAATAIAQISNVFGAGFPIAQVENFGSALVALGNDGASTEAQILDIAQRMSGMARVAGMSVQDTLGFANAVASVGINAEVGGSSMSRLMASMSKAVQTNSQDLANYAMVSGVTADQFARQWRERPAEAIAMFVAGLGKMNEEGGNTMGVLSDLKLSQVGLSQTLLSLAGSGDLLTDSLALSNEAWAANSALAEEAGKRYETTESKIAMAKNQLVEVGISIGSTLLPALASAADGLADLLGWFADLPDGIQRTVTVFGTIVGVAALVGGSMMLLVPKIVALRTSMATLRDEVPRTTSAMGKIGKAFSVVGAVLALGQIAGALINASQDANAAEKSLERMKNAAQGGEWQNVFDLFGGINTESGLGDSIEGYAAALELLVGGSFDSKMERFGQTLNDMFFQGALSSQVSDAQTQFSNLSTTLGDMVTSGSAEQAAAGFRELATEAAKSGVSQAQLLDLLPDYRDALYQVATAQGLTLTETQLLALASGDLATAGLSVEQSAELQTAALEATAAGLGMTAEQYEAAQKAAQEMVLALAGAVGGFVDANGTFVGLLDEGEDAWSSYKDGVSVSIDELNAKLREQVEAQTNWSSNLLSLAGTLSSETIAYLQSLGAEGAPLVQQLFKEMTEGNTTALAEFDANVQRMVGITPMAMADIMLKGSPLISHVASTQGQEAANALAAALTAGETTVEAAAAALGMKVQLMPDGTYMITADVTPAEEAIAELPETVAAGPQPQLLVDADTTGAQGDIDEFVGDQSTMGPIEVPVSANYSDAENKAAAFVQYASETAPMIVCDADTGEATVTVDAFKAWVATLDPEAKVGASTDPATGEVEAFITWADGSKSEVTVNANDGNARSTVTTFEKDTNRASGTVTVHSNDASARGTTQKLLDTVNASSGTVGIKGNPDQANTTLGAVISGVNAASGAVKVSTTKSATWWDTIASVVSSINSQTATVKVSTRASMATGGAVQYRAVGGAVHGPGTGTSDDVNAIGPWGSRYRLSNGEHILTAKEVQMMGGQAGVYQWRALLAAGRLPDFPGFATGGAFESRPTFGGAPQISVNPMVNVNPAEPVMLNPTYHLSISVEDLEGLSDVLEFAGMVDVKVAQQGSRSRRNGIEP